MSSEHVEVLRRYNKWRRGADGPMEDPKVIGLAIDAAIASLSAPQPPAGAQPVAWMDPDTEDVIHDMRKTSWSTDYGVGGEKKARTYTTPLYAHPPPSAPVGDDPIDASDNAEYIEHCADRLERLGLRVTAGALRVIAHEHRTLSQQPAAVDGWRLVVHQSERDTKPAVWATDGDSFVWVADLAAQQGG